MDWDTVLLPCIAQYSPPAPDSFQDVANQINQDYTNGLMLNQWTYYNFPYNEPPTPPDEYESYVGRSVVSLLSPELQVACLETGTIYFMDWQDTANLRGRLWFIDMSGDLPWPPQNYPE